MKKRTAAITAAFLLAALGARAEERSTSHPRFHGGPYAGWAAQEQAGVLVSLSSGMDQVVSWSQTALDLATLTIETEVPAGWFANGDTIRVSVPADWQPRFDTGVTVTYGGNASGKVAPATFSSDGHTLQIPVTRDFIAGDRLTVSGLKLVNLIKANGDTRRLELDYTGDGARDVYDDYPMTVTVIWSGGAYDGFDDAATTEGDTVR